MAGGFSGLLSALNNYLGEATAPLVGRVMGAVPYAPSEGMPAGQPPPPTAGQYAYNNPAPIDVTGGSIYDPTGKSYFAAPPPGAAPPPATASVGPGVAPPAATPPPSSPPATPPPSIDGSAGATPPDAGTPPPTAAPAVPAAAPGAPASDPNLIPAYLTQNTQSPGVQASEADKTAAYAQAANYSGSDSTPTQPSGSHPSDGAASTGGWADALGSMVHGITDVLENPLVQGAATAYLGAISAPRGSSLGGRIGLGGLAGLKALSEGSTAQTERAEKQQEIAQQALKTRGMQLSMRPPDPQTLQTVESYGAQLEAQVHTAKNPLDRQIAAMNLLHLNSLVNQAKAGYATQDSLEEFLKEIDPAKQAAASSQAQLDQMKAANMQTQTEFMNNYMSRMGMGGQGGQPAMMNMPMEGGGNIQMPIGGQAPGAAGAGPMQPGTAPGQQWIGGSMGNEFAQNRGGGAGAGPSATAGTGGPYQVGPDGQLIPPSGGARGKKGAAKPQQTAAAAPAVSTQQMLQQHPQIQSLLRDNPSIQIDQYQPTTDGRAFVHQAGDPPDAGYLFNPATGSWDYYGGSKKAAA